MKFTLVSQTGNLVVSKNEKSKILTANFIGDKVADDINAAILMSYLPRSLFPKGMEEGDEFEIEVTIKKVEKEEVKDHKS